MGRGTIDLDADWPPIEDRDGPGGTLVRQIHRTALDGGGFQIAIEIEHAEGRFRGRGFDRDGSRGKPQSCLVGDGPDTPVDHGWATPGNANAPRGFEDEAVGDSFDALDIGGGGGEQWQILRQNRILEIERDATEGLRGEVDELEELGFKSAEVE